jgi:thiamine biosynthesis lipoprotein
MSIYTFSHEAMLTTFTLRIRDEKAEEAAGVARECFDHLDYLENKLSRYIEGSDVWQINNMEEGDSLFISEACHECLRSSMLANEQTGGLFDITLGRQIEHLKNQVVGASPARAGQLVIDPDRPLVQCVEPGREIDLGGIGKGYALDRMKRLLEDWGIGSALLAAGASTHLVHGIGCWEIELRGDSGSTTIELEKGALSASGTAMQGSHIVSPFMEKRGYPFKRIWITNTNAALSDAWSTALMLVPREEIRQLDLGGERSFVETAEGDVVPVWGA